MNDSRKYLILTFWPVVAMVLFTAAAVYVRLDAQLTNWIQGGIVVTGLIGVLWKSFRDVRREKARIKELRQATKPVVFLFHENWCPHPKTATCLCGKEPFYSPANRRARGEIK